MASVRLIYSSLLFSLLLSSIEGRNTIPLTEEEDLELEKELQSLNKPPVKVIKQSFSEDLFDCIEKHKQPAFDHPALKNHKLQIRPSFHTNMVNMTRDEKFKSHLDLGFNDTCPPGTVLIRRTRKEDLIMSKELTKYFRKYGSTHRVLDSAVQDYYAIVQSKKGSFYGFHSKISLWGLPNVGKDQVSDNIVWIFGDVDGPAGSLNAIHSGWHVLPLQYNDRLTRFFTYWTINNYQTGCMNLNCKGFVQVSPNYAPGFAFPQVSIYGGKQEYLDLFILKDPESGNWWLTFPSGGKTWPENIGYWPKELFPSLDFATEIDFGGHVYTHSNEASPPMGSGSFPGEGTGKASYFRGVQFVGADRQPYIPDEDSVVFVNDKQDKYYQVSGERPKGGFDVAYGGPGGLVVG